MAGYGSDSGFTDYLAETGRTLPGTATAAYVRQVGSDYVDATYGERFPGQPVNGISQERAWPRSGATDRWGNSIATNVVPECVVKASYEAAWLDANNSGIFSKTYTPAEQKVLTEVKGIKWTVTGDASKSGSAMVRSTVVEGMLFPVMIFENLPGIMVV